MDKTHRTRLIGVLCLAALAAALMPGAASSQAAKVKLGIIGFCKADITGNAVTAEMRRQAKQRGWEVDYQARSVRK